MIILRLAAALIGTVLIVGAFFSAVRAFVLPRSAPDLVSRIVFINLRRLFHWRLRQAQTYLERDRIMAIYAPLSLLLLPPTWLFLVTIGFANLFWATGVQPWYDAFLLSGSSILTLGFAVGDTTLHSALSFAAATLGLMFIALLISYLPTIYAAFSRRETTVSLLDIRAGSPPSAVEMISRFHRLERLHELRIFWQEWERWFAHIEESHTSLAALVFFRSPRPGHSWVTASGAILDAASLALSTLDVPFEPRAALCIRAGYVALRRIADFFRVAYNANPQFPDEPISISREEYEAACERLQFHGVSLKPDREQAWRDFAGWRVNYDRVLIALCSLTMAPDAPWSSDRAPVMSVQALVRRGLES